MKLNSWHIRLCGTVALLLFCLLPVPRALAGMRTKGTPQADTQFAQKNGSDYVLILNAFSESAPWSRNIIDTVMNELLVLAPKLLPLTENLNLALISGEQDLARLQHRIDSTYTRKPRMVIYTGTSGWGVMHETIQRKWGNVPTILFAEENFIGPEHNYIAKEAIAPDKRIPLEQIAAKRGEMTVVYLPVYIRETISLMERLIPGMDELLFLSDDRWISTQRQTEVAAITKMYFPKLKVQYLSANNISTPDLFDSLQHRGPHTGALFFSWTRQASQGINSAINDATVRAIAKYARQPLFVLDDIDVNTDSDILGGYFLPRKIISHEIRSVLTDALAGQMQPLRTVSGAVPVFDYMSLIRKGLNPDLLPEDTYLYWKPESFFSQYRYQLAGFGLFGIILLLLIYILYRSRQQQRRQLELMTGYRNLLVNMPIAYMQMEVLFNEAGQASDLIVRDINPTFEKSLMPQADVIGRKASMSGNLKDENALNWCRAVLTEKRTISVPYYFKPTNTTFTAILSLGQKANSVNVFFVDNTVLIETQQQLRTVNHKLAMALEVADITPWKWDLTNQTILCDVQSVKMGQTSADENKLSTPEAEYFAKVHKQDHKRVIDAYQELIEGRVEKLRQEYRLVSRKKHQAPFEWVEVQAAVDSRDENGRPLTLIGSSVVITARKNMENELISAKEKAEESSRLKSAFLANMSHEIRTPLNAIVGFSGILASTETEEEKQEYVSIIENNNTLLLQLISDILDISKIEAGTLEFVFTDTELLQLLEEIVQATQMRNTSDKVKVELTEAPDCFIRTERNRLTQLLTNLLTNALKFTQEGSIQVGCRLQEDKKFLYFYVKDTGCGIPADKQQAVFNRFVKLNNFSQGTGLGLSICQTIVEHVGGQIGVESEEGKGSTFWFTIPYRPTQRQDTSVPQAALEQTAVERDKLTILIAEDSADNFKLFETTLKKEYRILHAWDGREAVELFKEYNPHMILMDINMPVMNGYEATTEIRKLSASVPIIAVTAYAYASDEKRIMQNGFDAYMPKPINAALMRKKIIELMKKRLIFI